MGARLHCGIPERTAALPARDQLEHSDCDIGRRWSLLGAHMPTGSNTSWSVNGLHWRASTTVRSEWRVSDNSPAGVPTTFTTCSGDPQLRDAPVSTRSTSPTARRSRRDPAAAERVQPTAQLLTFAHRDVVNRERDVAAVVTTLASMLTRTSAEHRVQ